ncbi:MAG: hypothetical protein NTY46_16820 [Candidatus Sumerlaeota bacterium]|nr:hypothetical protein [Candidatus Sumerlaeota bacterium]
MTVWLSDIFERGLALWRDRRDGRIDSESFAPQASELRAELERALRPAVTARQRDIEPQLVILATRQGEDPFYDSS